MNCRCYSVDEVILIISRRIYYEAEDFRLFGGTQEWTAFNFYRRCKVVLRSRSDIANKLGVTPQYVSRILSGNTNFSFKSMAEIERKLGILSKSSKNSPKFLDWLQESWRILLNFKSILTIRGLLMAYEIITIFFQNIRRKLPRIFIIARIATSHTFVSPDCKILVFLYYLPIWNRFL